MTNFQKYLKKSEQETAIRTIKALLKAGHKLSVFDGEEVTIEKSTDLEVIRDAMGTTEEDVLFVYANQHPERIGFVQFVWGNEDWVAIADYTTNLEGVLKPVFDWMDAQEMEQPEPAEDEQTERCVYCGGDVPLSKRDAALGEDDEAWQDLAQYHTSGCDWIRSRAHRYLDRIA